METSTAPNMATTLRSAWQSVVSKTPSAVLSLTGATIGAFAAGYVGSEVAGTVGTYVTSIAGAFVGAVKLGYIEKRDTETWNSFNSNLPEHQKRENRQLLGSLAATAAASAIAIYSLT